MSADFGVTVFFAFFIFDLSSLDSLLNSEDDAVLCAFAFADISSVELIFDSFCFDLPPWRLRDFGLV